MFAADFLLDNQRASDLGLMICSFDDNPEAATGGEIEYNVVKTPGRDNFTFYGSQFNSVITWSLSICKNPCRNKNMYFNQYEESMVMKWLVKTDGYRFIQFEQDGYEDIFYNVYINALPHQTDGKTVGFDLTVISDCAYGYTDVITKNATIYNSIPLKINVHSDINTYILPTIKIKGTGNFSLETHRAVSGNAALPITDNSMVSKSVFKYAAYDIFMDSRTGTIEGLKNPEHFNWHFLKLVDGANIMTTNSVIGVNVEIQYREPRYVRI